MAGGSFVTAGAAILSRAASLENRIALGPPEARREPKTRVFHGIELVDEYAWLRAPNWREALHDPNLLAPEILDHVKAENAYAEWVLAPLGALRREVFEELKRASEPVWVRPPQPYGPYLYGIRYGEGEHPILVRSPRAGGPETVLLDCNELARGRAFFKLGGWRVSPDHRLLAYAADVIGSEDHRIRIRDIDAGTERPDEIVHASGRMMWSPDSRRFYYVGLDGELRPNRVMAHPLGEAGPDAELFVEHDPAWWVWINPTSTHRLATISLRNSDDSEVHLFDPAAARPEIRVVERRRPGLGYDVDDWGDRLVIRTNADGALDYKLVTAPLDAPGLTQWRDLVPHRPGISILNHRCLSGYLVRVEREDANLRIVVRPRNGGDEHTIPIAEALYSLRLEPGCEYETTAIRYTLSTPVQPERNVEYDVLSRASVVIKRQPDPPGFDLSRYDLTRLWARAPDGEAVPVSVISPKDYVKDGSAPCLLNGYGSYGWSSDPDYLVERLPLLKRGFVYAIAHVRGGSERGRRWYREGKLEARANTFSDFVASAEALVEAGFTRSGRIVIHGRSAGGMLVGAALNLDPGLFGGVIADVPFVDVLNTMLDDELPMTPGEWLEWGDPLRDREAFLRLKGYAPYEAIREAAYPPVLATGGISDPRVTYWEPVKWILRLRDRASGGPFLSVTELNAGHSGNEGRTRRLDDRAREIAFALRCAGLA